MVALLKKVAPSTAEPGRGCLLIVDDDPAVTSLLGRMLQGQGYEVKSVDSGEACLVELEKQTPAVILLDIGMEGGIDGYETCRQIRKDFDRSDLTIIFLSGYDSPEHRLKAYDSGGDDFIAKPFKTEELRRKIDLAVSARMRRTQLVIEKLTLEKQAEIMRTEQHLMIQTIIDTTPGFMVLKDINHVYREANPAFCKFLGKSREEIVGKIDLELFPPDEAAAFSLGDAEVLQTGKVISRDELVTGAKGRRWLSVNKSPVMDHSGRVSGVLCSVLDITERKQAEEDLRHSEQRFYDIARASGDWIWEIDAAGIYTFASGSVRELLGYTPAEIIGKTPFDLMPPDEAARVGADFVAIAAHGASFRDLANTVRHKDGSLRHVQTNGVPILDAEGKLRGYRGVDRDITQSKKTADMLQKSEARFHQMFQNNALVMLLVELDSGAIVDANPAAARFYGYSVDHLKTMHIDQINTLSPEEIADRRAKAALLQQNFFIFPHRLSNGEVRTVEVCSSPIESNGQPLLFSIIQDITENEHQAKELTFHREHLEELVNMRTAALESANRRLAASDQRLTAMLDMSQRAHHLNEEEIQQLGIEEAVRLTGSEIGYLHFINANQESLTLGTWSQGTLALCKAAFDNHYPVSAAGIWADTVRTHRPVIHNDYQNMAGLKGYPAGHVHLNRHLGVPVIEDGEVRLLMGVGNKKKDYDDGDVQQLQMIGRDIWSIITRRRAELALTTAEMRNRLIIDSSADGILQLDTAGRIGLVNPAACKMLGFAPEELLGRDAHTAIHCPHESTAASQTPCSLSLAISAGQVFRTDKETFWRADGNPLQVAVAIHPMRQGERLIGAVLNFSDNTQRQAAEEAREVAREAAEQLARIKSEFLANMSHEIRTPLNGVLGMAQIGYRDSIGRGKNQETFARIIESGKLLLAIINDILDFSKIEAGKLSIESIVVDPGHCLDDTVASLAERAKSKGLRLVAEKAPDLPAAVLGDPTRITQILLNLLSNAIKFTAHGEIRLAALRVDGHLVFRVSDSGIGMTPEQLTNLFTPFQQADGSITRKYGGTGLGLTISRQLAHLMGGEIYVTSQAGSGSTFDLHLPCNETTPAVSMALPGGYAEASKRLRLKGLHILAAEDDEVNQLVLEDLLTREGADLELVGNGRLAVDSVVHNPAAFDLVLMDVQMPEMDGHEATRRIRDIAPALPVIGQTAHAMAKEHQECRAAGMVDTITKPLDHEALVSVILRHARPIGKKELATSAQSHGSAAKQNLLLDWAQLVQRYSNRPGFMTKLLGIALKSQSDGPARLRAAAAADDMAQLALLAHTLKGTGGNLYAQALQTQAQATEIAARVADPDAIGHAEQLAEMLDAVLAEIRKHLA